VRASKIAGSAGSSLSRMRDIRPRQAAVSRAGVSRHRRPRSLRLCPALGVAGALAFAHPIAIQADAKLR
jgi:hypothetical protein